MIWALSPMRRFGQVPSYSSYSLVRLHCFRRDSYTALKWTSTRPIVVSMISITIFLPSKSLWNLVAFLYWQFPFLLFNSVEDFVIRLIRLGQISSSCILESYLFRRYNHWIVNLPKRILTYTRWKNQKRLSVEWVDHGRNLLTRKLYTRDITLCNLKANV